jgi:hypothetical protein
VLGGHRGEVVNGLAVYEVLPRDGPGLTLAHCWGHKASSSTSGCDGGPFLAQVVRQHANCS